MSQVVTYLFQRVGPVTALAQQAVPRVGRDQRASGVCMVNWAGIGSGTLRRGCKGTVKKKRSFSPKVKPQKHIFHLWSWCKISKLWLKIQFIHFKWYWKIIYNFYFIYLKLFKFDTFLLLSNVLIRRETPVPEMTPNTSLWRAFSMQLPGFWGVTIEVCTGESSRGFWDRN